MKKIISTFVITMIGIAAIVVGILVYERMNQPYPIVHWKADQISRISLTTYKEDCIQTILDSSDVFSDSKKVADLVKEPYSIDLMESDDIKECVQVLDSLTTTGSGMKNADKNESQKEFEAVCYDANGKQCGQICFYADGAQTEQFYKLEQQNANQKLEHMCLKYGKQNVIQQIEPINYVGCDSTNTNRYEICQKESKDDKGIVNEVILLYQYDKKDHMVQKIDCSPYFSEHVEWDDKPAVFAVTPELLVLKDGKNYNFVPIKKDSDGKDVLRFDQFERIECTAVYEEGGRFVGERYFIAGMNVYDLKYNRYYVLCKTKDEYETYRDILAVHAEQEYYTKMVEGANEISEESLICRDVYTGKEKVVYTETSLREILREQKVDTRDLSKIEFKQVYYTGDVRNICCRCGDYNRDELLEFEISQKSMNTSEAKYSFHLKRSAGWNDDK